VQLTSFFLLRSVVCLLEEAAPEGGRYFYGRLGLGSFREFSGIPPTRLDAELRRTGPTSGSFVRSSACQVRFVCSVASSASQVRSFRSGCLQRSSGSFDSFRGCAGSELSLWASSGNTGKLLQLRCRRRGKYSLPAVADAAVMSVSFLFLRLCATETHDLSFQSRILRPTLILRHASRSALPSE